MNIDYQIPSRANRVLNLLLIALLLIFTRSWYLAVVQRDEKKAAAVQPQRKTVIERVERATIRDRFNIPLAVNKIQYNAAICYAPIRQIPTSSWKKDEKGKPYRKMVRKDYVLELSQLLGKELKMDPQQIEDTIWAKASLLPHTPFILKEDISEQEYYRLRMLEKQWTGVQTERTYKRIYPQEKIGADIIGFLGAIDQKKHYEIAQETKLLQSYLEERERSELPLLPKGFSNPIQVRKRLRALEEKAYTMNDLVGKTGIESLFDEKLRGVFGKKRFEVDVKGMPIRELPGARNPIGGQRVILSLCAELQEYAEQLLAQNETEKNHSPGLPWIKGGAIVALIPQTGEVLTLASYPRLNPNDFVPTGDPRLRARRQSQIPRWLESESYIGEMWDGKRPLERECYSFPKNKFYEEGAYLSWERYLNMTLSQDGGTREILDQIPHIQKAIAYQEEMKNRLGPNKTEQLALDICRLVADQDSFSPELLSYIGGQSLSEFRHLTQVAVQAQSELKSHMQKLFHRRDFQEWRTREFKEFLKEKRQEEKDKKQYARPYTDYLEQMEKKMFKEYWERSRYELLFSRIMGDSDPSGLPYKEIFASLKAVLETMPKPLAISYLSAMRSFDELNRPLLAQHKHLRHINKKQFEKHLASAFYPVLGFGYGRSQAYRQSAQQGSIFKVVTAYEALRQKYELLKSSHSSLMDLNPLTLVDEMKASGTILGYTLDGEVLTRNYKGGILPRATHTVGKIDLLGAFEHSSNVYFSYLASECLEKPDDLANAAKLFGYGEKTGIDLPGEYAGNIPSDLEHNKTGLYSFAIGHHTLAVTPLQTARMIAAIVNGGQLLRPKMIHILAGKEAENQQDLLFSAFDYPFKDSLGLAGITFPLFTEVDPTLTGPSVSLYNTQVKRNLFLPDEIRSMILNGMHQVIAGARGTARPSLIRDTFENPQIVRDYVDLKNKIVGKTGTAETMYRNSIDPNVDAVMLKHVWFTCVSFKEDSFMEEPELVVVVYLRFGISGREGAPLAAQIVKKWREICARHGRTSAF